MGWNIVVAAILIAVLIAYVVWVFWNYPDSRP